MITWDTRSDKDEANEPPSPLPPPSQQQSLSPSYDLPGSSSQPKNTTREQIAEGFGGQLDSVNNNKHEMQPAGSDEDVLRGGDKDISRGSNKNVLRGSTNEIAIAPPDTDVEVEADADIDTIEEETDSEDNRDLFIVSSFVSFNPDLIVP